METSSELHSQEFDKRQNRIWHHTCVPLGRDGELRTKCGTVCLLDTKKKLQTIARSTTTRAYQICRTSTVQNNNTQLNFTAQRQQCQVLVAHAILRPQ